MNVTHSRVCRGAMLSIEPHGCQRVAILDEVSGIEGNIFVEYLGVLGRTSMKKFLRNINQTKTLCWEQTDTDNI